MNRVKRSLLTASIVLAMAFTQSFAQEKGSFTDARDKKTYKTVKIGKQVWMAENLNYNAKDSKCYDNKEENCEQYGRLYDFYQAEKACPAGWHLATVEEWGILREFTKSGTGKVKAKSGWKIYDFSGKSSKDPKCKYEEVKINSRKKDTTIIERDYCATDEYGFAALPGGTGDNGGNFWSVGDYSSWWSEVITCYIFMGYDSNGWGELLHNSYKNLLLSVRCLQD